MLITTDGLVIRRRETGDASCYIDILTQEYGVIEALAHGVKKLTNRNSPAASLYAYSTFCLNKNGLKYTLNSARPKYSFHGLSGDILALSLCAYFCEVIKYASASEQQGGEVLLLALTALYELEKKRIPFALIKALFELRLTKPLGFAPDLTACANCACYAHKSMYFPLGEGIIVCADCYDDFDDTEFSAETPLFILPPETLRVMRGALYAPLKKIFRLAAEKSQLRELGTVAEEYLLYHLGRGFKTLAYYKALR